MTSLLRLFTIQLALTSYLPIYSEDQDHLYRRINAETADLGYCRTGKVQDYHCQLLQVTSLLLRGAHGILVVFDLTDSQSLKDVTFWLEEIDKHGNTHPSVILIGNKADKTSKRQVSEEEGHSFAKKHGLDYVECSALNALNINLVF